MVESESLPAAGKNEVFWRGRRLLYFSGCDYFRLARDPRVSSALRLTLAQHGLTVAASRITTGNHELYGRLEAALAEFFGAGSAIVFPDGYLAPLAVAQSLAGECTHVVMDELTHGALKDAAKLMACPIKTFKHRNVADLEKILAGCGKMARPAVLTDGMFAHDGSVAPLRAYLKCLPSRALMLVDDAHGAGVLGATGQGSLEFERVGRHRIIQCITLSKALGVYGGAVLCSQALRKKIVATSRIFRGTTPLPLPLAGAALASLNILRAEPERRRRLLQNTARLREALAQRGWNIEETPGPIVLLPAFTASATEHLKKRLLAAGIYSPFLKYGAATQGAFRFVISSEHTREQLDRVAQAVGEFKQADLA